MPSVNKMFTVSGSMIIPGTRSLVRVEPIKVSAPDPLTASKQLVGFLTEKFRKELPHGHSFSAGFAYHHLQGLRGAA